MVKLAPVVGILMDKLIAPLEAQQININFAFDNAVKTMKTVDAIKR